MNIKIALLSLLPPAGILTGLYWYLSQPSDSTAGSIHPDITAIDRLMDDSQPDIIIVGSSLANYAIHQQHLAKNLGLEENKIQKLWSGMATISAITLMIENRILSRNLRPKTVIIVSTPFWLVNNQILLESNFTMHQTNPLSPILSEKLGKTLTVSPSTFQQKKLQVQDDYAQLNQQIFGEWLLERTPAEVESQLESVFDFEEQRTDGVTNQQLIQHNVRQTEDTDESTETTQNIDTALIQYLAEQLAKADINLVVALVPVSDIVKKSHQIPPQDLQHIVEILNAHDARLLDYFEWSEPNMFVDTKHMNRRGRSLFTKKFSDDLQAMGILNDQLKEVALPEVLSKPTMKWSAAEGKLPAAEYLTLTFPVKLTDTPISVCAAANTPTTLLSLPNTKVQRQGKQHIWCEAATIKTIEANSSLEFRNSSTNPVTIHSIEVGETELISQPRFIQSTTDWIIEASNRIDSITIMETPEPGPWLLKKSVQFPNLQVGTLAPQYQHLTDVPLRAAGIAQTCRPLEALIDNQSIDIGTCKEMWQKKKPYCLHAEKLLGIVDMPIDWSQSAIRLKEARGCHYTLLATGFGWWVYPGDTASTGFNRPKGDYSKLYIEGQSLGEGPWSVKLYKDDTTFVTYTTEEPLNLSMEIPLDIVMPIDDAGVRIAFEVPEDSDTFLFIRKAKVQN